MEGFYTICEIENGRFFGVEKKEIKPYDENFIAKNMRFYEDLESDVMLSDVFMSVGRNGEVVPIPSDYIETWVPFNRERIVREISEEDRERMMKAVADARRQRYAELDRYMKNYR